jgi:hypothetical protein
MIQLIFFSASSSYCPFFLKVMVRLSSVWTWCRLMVRVSPTASACRTPTEPTRRRQAARPARLTARETLNPDPA